MRQDQHSLVEFEEMTDQLLAELELSSSDNLNSTNSPIPNEITI